MDLYYGEKVVLDYFLERLFALRDKIETKNINISDFTVNINNSYNHTIVKTVENWLLNIYIKKDFSNIQPIKVVNDTKLNDSFASHIKSFTTDLPNVCLGDCVTFSWICKNPFKLLFSDGFNSLNVTNQEQIKIDVLQNNYYLTLYDDKYKMIERKEITLTILSPTYCINCGNKRTSKNDIFCTECGVKF